MKTIKYLLVVALAGAALTGCSKKDSNYNVVADNVLPSLPNANLSLVVQTIAQKPGGLVKWDMGGIAATQIVFDGTQFTGGDMLTLAEYTDKAIKAIDIVHPSTTNLGAVLVPFGKYQRVTFGLKLAPVGVTTTASLANSLFLSGSYYSTATANPMARGAFGPVPVQVIINDPVLMNSTWFSKVTLQQSNYAVNFVIDVNNVMAGIDETMLNNAVRTNGVVYITNVSNQNLYGFIIKNLENHLMEARMSVPPVNVISTNVAANGSLRE